ncbi:MAG: AAA family ATPase [Methylococcales bacterium]|nr:AAA family ATPase [Methylococcales bacterium]MDP3839840.1 AAA family ATPase [Methylococcales bacterium]
MEYIEINGFLTIDHAHFEIKKINILIGAQAQGKSVIAKLVYFFTNYFSETFLESIQKLKTKRYIDTKCLVQFGRVFPRYSWANQDFSIIYRNGNYAVSIIRTKIDNKYNFKFNYCNELANFHKELKNNYKLALDDFDTRVGQENRTGNRETIYRENIFYELISKKIYSHPIFSNILKTSIFIPAGRSFFAILQKNIFSFLAKDIDIDPFIKEFGSRYEQSKRLHQGDFFRNDDSIEVTRKKVDKLVSNIVVGEYTYAEEQDWILNTGKRTNLSNASSGQQESLPMLLVLKTSSFNYGTTTFFIEEPEAHLFPTSQKQIISLIATIYNAFGHSFFITTHSPYILTAINNLVVGKDAYDKANGDKEKLKRLEKVLPTDELIRLEDVSAYTLNKGKLESIIDMENRLIGANLLDAVSDEFDLAFGVATEILYGDD